MSDLNDNLKIKAPKPTRNTDLVGLGQDYLAKEAIPSEMRYPYMPTTVNGGVDDGKKYRLEGGLLNENWVEQVSTPKTFYYPINFINTTQQAKILAEFDFTIDAESHDGNITDVRIGVNVSPIAPVFPIVVATGDLVNIEITATVTNQVSVVNLKCTKA